MIASILTQSILVWYDRASKKDLIKLNSIIKDAEGIINSKLPSLEQIYVKRLESKVGKILKDSDHPARHYFEYLPHGRRLRAFKGSARFVNSFYPQAIKHLNKTRLSKGRQ